MDQPGIGVQDAIIYFLHSVLAHLELPRSTVRIILFDFSSVFKTIKPLLLGKCCSEQHWTSGSCHGSQTLTPQTRCWRAQNSSHRMTATCLWGNVPFLPPSCSPLVTLETPFSIYLKINIRWWLGKHKTPKYTKSCLAKLKPTTCTWFTLRTAGRKRN